MNDIAAILVKLAPGSWFTVQDSNHETGAGYQLPVQDSNPEPEAIYELPVQDSILTTGN